MKRNRRILPLVVGATLLLCGRCVAESPTPLPDKVDLSTYGQALMRMIGYLLLIIVGLLVAARALAWWMRRQTPPGGGKVIELVEQHRLEPRKSVYLLRVAGKYILVGSSEGRLQTLAGGELDQSAIAAALGQAAEPKTPERSFADVLDEGRTIS